MPRPGSESETPIGQGFGPSAAPTTQLGNYAPLNVQGAPSQAALLAKSLGVVSAEEGNTLDRRARMQGSADQDQGAAAAAMGQVDPELQARNTGYAVGAQRVSAQSSALNAVSAWEQKVGKDPSILDQPVQKVMQDHDDFMRTQLGGLENDSVSAKAILPIVQGSANEVLKGTVQRQIASTQAAAVDTSVRLAQAQALHPDQQGLFDYNAEFEKVRTVFGSGPNAGARAQETLVDAIGKQAVASNTPSMMNLIVPPPGTTNLSPDVQFRVNEYQKEAQSGYDKAHLLQSQQANADAQKTYIDMINRNVAPTWSQLSEDVAAKKITEEQQLEYYKQGQNLTDQATGGRSALSLLLNASDPWYTHVGGQITDSKGAVVTDSKGQPTYYKKEDFEHATTQYIESYPVEQRPARAVQWTANQGLIYEPLKATFDNMPLTDPKSVKQGLDAYAQMRNVNQQVASQYFADPATKAKYDYALDLRQMGQSDQQIADAFVNNNTKEAVDRSTLRTTAVMSALGGSTKISGVATSDFANGGEVTSRLTQLTNTILRGNVVSDPKTAMNLASTQLADQSYLIKLSDGHSLLMPRDVGHPEPADAQSALQWFYDKKLPDIVSKSDGNNDPKDVVLTTPPGLQGVLMATNHMGLPVNNDHYTVDGIIAGYRKDLSEQVRASQASNQTARPSIAAARSNLQSQPNKE